MLATERRKYILEQLNLHGIINVNEMANALHIHETTIRRDLEKLEQEGKLIRIHGGAKLNEDSIELTMKQKLDIHFQEKKAVCQRASEYVQDGDCIFIDGGTTTYPMIDYLVHKKIKIVTHNDLIIRRIKNCEAEIISIGGKYLPHYNMSVGANAIHQINQYHFDACFISCVGVNAKEKLCYTSEEETLDVKRAAMNNSDHAYLLIDSSKFNTKGFCKLASFDEFDKILCSTFYTETQSIKNLEFV